MSQKPVDLNPDLRRLRDLGYHVEVRSGSLIVSEIPYVDSQRQVRRGTLVSELTMLGDRTQRPSTHVMKFAGTFPCHADGTPIEKIRSSDLREEVFPGLVVSHSFSSKPLVGFYADYFEKVHTYATILSSQAQVIDPNVSPFFVRPLVPSEENTVFNYIDTASSRAGTVAVNRKLMMGKIAIIGLGGTGSYVLDFMAKTPVEELHLFDGDKFFQHNAFRAPGAPSLEDIAQGMFKVDYLAKIYGRMRRGIVAHAKAVTRAELDLLKDMDFVFLCMDSGPAKRMIIEALHAAGKSFIDVGMGLELVDDVLTGIVRVTTSTPGHRNHVWDNISCADNAAANVYTQNIQIAEMNAFNATLAVIQWKKLCGFYFDPVPSFNITYSLGANALLREAAANDDIAA